MLCSLLPVPPLPFERPENYARRRGKIVAKIAVDAGLWSIRWCEAISKWQEHIVRDSRAPIFNAVLTWYGATWLEAERIKWLPTNSGASSVLSATAGKLNSRPKPGRPPTRWDAGLIFAEQWPAQSNRASVGDGLARLHTSFLRLFY